MFPLLFFACQSEPQSSVSEPSPSAEVSQEKPRLGPNGLPINTPKGPPPSGMKGKIGPQGGPNTAAGSGGEFQFAWW